MKLTESERLEVKDCVTDKVVKTIIAFANHLGGAIYIGIDDFGNTVGVDNVDTEMLRVSNMVHDSIAPGAVKLVEIAPLEHEGKQLIRISVEPGDDRPYYLASKGLVPSGVFTRLGPATVPMSRGDIRRMIRDADGVSFESEHCEPQGLTFDVAKELFNRHCLPFDDVTLGNLGIRGRDGFYTNLALLISDQNPFTLKCAVFNDDGLTEIINRIDCEGSIFKQIADAEAFLNVANGLRSYFVPGKLERIDKLDYPKLAIREGILNAVIHRDYDMRHETLVKMNRTQLQFLNFGGLSSISPEQAIAGATEARNPLLRQLVYRLNIVEALGTGLKRIYEQYEPEELHPQIDADGRWFRLVLPNVNTTRNPLLSLKENDGPNLRGEYDDYERLDDGGMLPPDVSRAFAPVRKERAELLAAADSRLEGKGGTGQARGTMRLSKLSTTQVDGCTVEHFLFELAAANDGKFSRQQAEEALGAGRDVTLKVINGMLEEGKLIKEGRARATRYRVAM